MTDISVIILVEKEERHIGLKARLVVRG